MPLVSRIIAAPQLRREAPHSTPRNNPAIISERAKAREPRCRRRGRLLAYALSGLTRKSAGNTGVFAKAREGHGAFTQTLRALRIAHGFEACHGPFRAHGRGGMAQARSEDRVSPPKEGRQSTASHLAREACTPGRDFCSRRPNSGTRTFGRGTR